MRWPFPIAALCSAESVLALVFLIGEDRAGHVRRLELSWQADPGPTNWAEGRAPDRDAEVAGLVGEVFADPGARENDDAGRHRLQHAA